MLSGILLAIQLLQAVLAAAKTSGLSQEVTADVEAALAKLQTVQGTPVTFEQLEGLRVTPKW